MWQKCKFTYLVIGLLLLLTVQTAFGQGTAEGLQLFAPADVSSYGRGPQPNEGFFFVYDLLYWTVSTPRVTTIGKEGLTRTVVIYAPNQTLLYPRDTIVQHNTLDTAGLDEMFDMGNRFEFGNLFGDRGWMVSLFQLRERSQSVLGYNVDMVFNEVKSGTIEPYYPLDGRFTNDNPPPDTFLAPLPLTFTNVLFRNDNSTFSIEFNYMGRSEQLHNGGFFEWFVGPRYIEFDDTFIVNAQGSPVMGNAYWQNEAQNNIIAGQIGGRFFKKQGRWTISTEGRGFAGLNCQNIHQTGQLGGYLGTGMSPGVLDSFQPYYMSNTYVNHSAFLREFTPGAELRLEARYQITRSANFHVGWTGVWMNNIARGSETIDYTLDPEHTWMGILRDHNKDNVFMNGLTVGIDINR
jgi:hypothetical protein